MAEDITSRDAFALIKEMAERYRLYQSTPEFSGSTLLDLSVGNPDLAPELRWRERLQYFISRDDLHGYGEFRPDINSKLRKSFAAYYQRRFMSVGATDLLDPDRNIVDLQGSKEGIFYSLLACLEPGEAVLMPDPSYTVYQSSAKMIGARVERFSCNEYGQPSLESIRPEQLERARILVVCSPCNPTGIVLSPDKLEEIITFAKRHGLWVVIDRAYAEIAFESVSEYPLSGAALPLPGALDRVLELHSLSKSCSLAGWRIGFAIGVPELITRIRKVKFNADFGTFLPLQCVATEMIDELEDIAARNSAVYASRMRRFVDGAASLGWIIPPSQGTFFLWAPLPSNFSGDDLDFTESLLKATGILVTPGSGFGSGGAGRVRIALVQSDEVLSEALRRLSKWSILSRPLAKM